MKITATELKELAIVDKVIPEVMNGQPLEQAKINRMLQKAFISKLTELAARYGNVTRKKIPTFSQILEVTTHQRTFQGLMGGFFIFLLFYLFFTRNDRPL